MTTTVKSLPALRYNAIRVYHEDGFKFRMTVKISLADDCKNKICHFSITADIERQAKNGRWVYYSGGCCHEEIKKHFPAFYQFINLHCCNHYGQETYAVENGIYYLVNNNLEYAKQYLRATDEEINTLKAIAATEDKQYFKYQLFALGIVDRWAQEANDAIKELERLCGCKWVNPYSPDEERFYIKPLTGEELDQINDRIKSGHYTPAAIQDRAQQLAQEKRDKQRAEIISRYENSIKRAQQAQRVMLTVFDFGIDTDNVIYYDHSNILSFNWKNYGDKIPQEVFVDFVNNVDRSQLPEGIQFKFN